jgi:hypothetical protein
VGVARQDGSEVFTHSRRVVGMTVSQPPRFARERKTLGRWVVF